VAGLDCGLGVLKTCRREAVAGTEGKGWWAAVICVNAPRISAGWGAGGGITVIAATAENGSPLSRRRELESSKMFIRENWSMRSSILNEAC